jgi:hypothetical protein
VQCGTWSPGFATSLAIPWILTSILFLWTEPSDFCHSTRRRGGSRIPSLRCDTQPQQRSASVASVLRHAHAAPRMGRRSSETWGGSAQHPPGPCPQSARSPVIRFNNITLIYDYHSEKGTADDTCSSVRLSVRPSVQGLVSPQVPGLN